MASAQRARRRARPGRAYRRRANGARSTRPAPAPAVVRVTGQTGAVCFLPGGKTVGPVELVKVPG